MKLDIKKILINMMCVSSLTLLTCHMTSVFAKEVSPLEKHIAYFADQNREVSKESMKEKLLQLGFGDVVATKMADIISYFSGILVKGCPYQKFTASEGVGKLNHARDTSIYNLDGSVNETRWQKLREYSEVDDGVEIITEKRLYEFLKWSRDQDTRPDPTGDATKFSDGEWRDFFNVATDHWKKTNDDYERSMTLKTLKTFYEDSPVIFERVKNKILPIPKPVGNISTCPRVSSIIAKGLETTEEWGNDPKTWVVSRTETKYDTGQYWDFYMMVIDGADSVTALENATKLLPSLNLVAMDDKNGYIECFYDSDQAALITFATNTSVVNLSQYVAKLDRRKV